MLFVAATAALLVLIVAAGLPAAEPKLPALAIRFIGDAPQLSEGAITEVKVGGEFAVTLEENPSTGYTWQYTALPVDYVSESAKESFQTDPGAIVGAPVITVWKLGTVREGEVTLTFLYYRSWEKPDTAVDKKVFTVKVVK
jgi:inhibitor of cysteine peptidase